MVPCTCLLFSKGKVEELDFTRSVCTTPILSALCSPNNEDCTVEKACGKSLCMNELWQRKHLSTREGSPL